MHVAKALSALIFHVGNDGEKVGFRDRLLP